MNAPAHFERMRRRFEEAAEREHVRRVERRVRRRRVAVAGVGAVALAAAVFVVANVRNPSAEASTVRVERAGDRVSVRLLALTTDTERVARDLTAAGVPAEVATATTGPSRVGAIVRVTIVGGRRDLLVASDPRSFQFVVAADVRVELVLGAKAPAGAPYDVPVDATADGEPLHCRLRVGDALSVARTVPLPPGLAVEWRLEEPGQVPAPIDVAALDDAAAARLSVQAARRLSDGLVQIAVAGQPPAPVATPVGCS